MEDEPFAMCLVGPCNTSRGRCVQSNPGVGHTGESGPGGPLGDVGVGGDDQGHHPDIGDSSGDMVGKPPGESGPASRVERAGETLLAEGKRLNRDYGNRRHGPRG